MKRSFTFNGKSVIVVAQLIENTETKYKFEYFSEGTLFNEYEKEVNGLTKEMDNAVEHAKKLLL